MQPAPRTSLPRTTSRHPRRTIVAGVVAFALVIAALVWWFVWVPNWRPPLRDGERYGIDVSAHQNEIDWERVAADGIDFAYIKATEGEDFVDETFTTNWKAARESGLDTGAYHFFTLCRTGAVQAANFLRVAQPTPDALAPAVDLEIAGNCSERPEEADVAAELDDFLRLVEDAWGREVVLYVGTDWEEVYPVRERLDRPLWLRRFLLRPSGDWQIWQLHGYARVEGVTGGVDINVGRVET